MIRCARSALIATLLLGAPVARADAQAPSCDGRTEVRVDQETYFALTDRVYMYVPDIDSSAGGWQAFTVRVLSTRYRKPMLLTKGFMKEKDVVRLLSTRSDMRTTPLAVPAHDPRRSSKAPALTASASVPNGEKTGTVTVRVSRVVPVSVGTDHIFIVCAAR